MTAFTEYETDVLVIGGGLAALRAALSARATGARVLVVVKRKLAKSGSSAITSGGFAAACSDLNSADDAFQHYSDTVVGGGWVNDRRLAQVLVDEAPERLRELWQEGVKFQMRDGQYYLSPSGDHRHPRVLVPKNVRGTDLTLPLLAAARAADVETLENTLIVDLLVDDGRVTGAVGIHRNKVGGCVIRAGATVLAAGGAGRLFSVTSNPVDVTGGGYALITRAGGMLRDMEFIQFYPWRLIRPFRSTRVPIQPSTFVSGAKLYNSRGERFMENYDPDKKETTTRDISARGIFDQIRLGLSVDGGVILDISDVEDEQFRFENRKVIERLDPRGVNYREIPLILGPEAHFMMGGALVDEFGATVLNRLYACGETAGGLHGGNRLNSNAVPETQVFGHRAGVAAAETALRRQTGRIDEEIVSKWRFRLIKIRDKNTNVSSELRAILKAFRDAMWLGLGIVRTAEGLRQALTEVKTTRMKVAALSTERLGDLIAHIELENLCDVATASASSALLRTESRAAHYRDDFPTTDPAWLSTVVYGGGRASVRPLPVEPDEEQRLAAAPLQSARSDEFIE